MIWVDITLNGSKVYNLYHQYLVRKVIVMLPRFWNILAVGINCEILCTPRDVTHTINLFAFSYFSKIIHLFDALICVNMAAVESFAKVSSKEMKMEDLNKLSNIFASEFNNSDIHDRVLCFEVIKDEELGTKVDNSEDNESESIKWL